MATTLKYDNADLAVIQELVSALLDKIPAGYGLSTTDHHGLFALVHHGHGVVSHVRIGVLYGNKVRIVGHNSSHPIMQYLQGTDYNSLEEWLAAAIAYYKLKGGK
jgi:hypothetical protein